jgi:hypothetical protein
MYVFKYGLETLEHSSPEFAIEHQLRLMVFDVENLGASENTRIPINHSLVDAYKSLGEKPSLSDVIDYEPIKLITDALDKITGSRPTFLYKRTFKPGQGEGTHTDPHNLVVTYCDGAAGFTIATAKKAYELKSHNIIAFDGTIPHEVSAPSGNRFRSITAIAKNI